MHVESQRKVARCPWKEAKCNAKLRELMMQPFVSKEKLAKIQETNKQIVKDLSTKPPELPALIKQGEQQIKEAGYEAIVIDDD